ncbi:hypothetical protein EWM64_g5367 [Hericium alpestre]|uniref:DUF7918 domain-containing protein n=1 Tax=Hericium alpestre TaxID=135208 RepID=A0A4Y9ZYR9_9AGAM|nr:hypothetical protein EWM64_g5367 [Hericium alpestre]
MDKIVRVYCDGRYMYGYGHHAGENHVIDGVRTSSTEMKSFTFSHVLVADSDNSALQSNVDISHLGLIEVRIFPAKIKDMKAAPIISSVNEIGVISELTKKGGLHQVSLGKSKIVPALTTVTWTINGPEKRPYASFLFRHRSAGILQAMGIMPRPPPFGLTRPSSALANKRTKSPNAADRSRGKRCRTVPAGGTEAEEDLKLRIEDEEDDPRIKLLQDHLKKIQDDLNSLLAAKSRSTRVKAEQAPSPIRVGAAAGKVIDLTD